MKRGLAFFGILMCGFAAGCGSDPLEFQVQHAISQGQDASAKLDKLQQNIGDAIERYQKASKEDKVLKLDEALQDCEKIKKGCAEMQKTMLDIQGLPGSISEVRRPALAEKFKRGLQDDFKTCDERRKKLDEKMTELKAMAQLTSMDETSKENIDKFTKKVDETLGEFDSLVRQH